MHAFTISLLALMIVGCAVDGFQQPAPITATQQNINNVNHLPTTIIHPPVGAGGANAATASPLFATAASSDQQSSSSSEAAAEAWTKPRFHNKPWVRSVAILTALALAGTSGAPQVLSANMNAAIHMLAFGTWLGTVFYTTFIAGLTMFKNLPRQTFGTLQSKLFPKYFRLCSITIVLQVSTIRSKNVYMHSIFTIKYTTEVICSLKFQKKD
jgi:hypothetical protein